MSDKNLRIFNEHCLQGRRDQEVHPIGVEKGFEFSIDQKTNNEKEE